MGLVHPNLRLVQLIDEIDLELANLWEKNGIVISMK